MKAARRCFCMAMVLAVALPAAAEAEPLVGTWTLVRVDNLMPDGTRVELYGPQPQGLLMFDAQGRYALQILRADRVRFAGNDKAKGTPDEYADAVRGSNAHFGRYVVNAADGTVIFHIERATFPNWEGTQQKRRFVLASGRLLYRVPTPTTGGSAIGEVEWQRADAPPLPAPAAADAADRSGSRRLGDPPAAAGLQPGP